MRIILLYQGRLCPQRHGAITGRSEWRWAVRQLKALAHDMTPPHHRQPPSTFLLPGGERRRENEGMLSDRQQCAPRMRSMSWSLLQFTSQQQTPSVQHTYSMHSVHFAGQQGITILTPIMTLIYTVPACNTGLKQTIHFYFISYLWSNWFKEKFSHIGKSAFLLSSGRKLENDTHVSTVKYAATCQQKKNNDVPLPESLGIINWFVFVVQIEQKTQYVWFSIHFQQQNFEYRRV